ncbi:hypothetical protein [uncultured Microbulbifer sp.]|uniref:hypothetical protein n=1 Tax=uncultured Microbulbifer sp. TaxID=348147 RepID=UPI00262ECE50|nr:hypothetical protein [uncultured Microbulbifer sp.]
MNYIKKLIFIFLVFFCSALVAADDQKNLDDFVSRFKSAVQSKDQESLMKMNYWSGLSSGQRESIENSFVDLAQKGIKNLNVRKIENGSTIEFKRGDLIFAPSLPPVAQLFVEVNTDQEFRGGYSFYVGRRNGAMKFCHIVPKNL